MQDGRAARHHRQPCGRALYQPRLDPRYARKGDTDRGQHLGDTNEDSERRGNRGVHLFDHLGRRIRKEHAVREERHGEQCFAAPCPASAMEWFQALTDTFGPALENRKGGVASAPAVMAALGAMGHTLVAMPDKYVRMAELQKRFDLLKSVNWSKGQHWEGIAGKFTPKGDFSLGGPKETAYAIYSALSDPQSSGYAQVRVGTPTPTPTPHLVTM